MKRLKKAVLMTVVVLILGTMMGCSLMGGRNISEKSIDFGTYDGNVYKNDFFGMSLTIPEEWTLADEEEIKELTKLGREMIAAEDQSINKILELADLTTIYFLVASNDDPFNPASVVVLAEKLNFTQNIRDEEVYLEVLKESMGTYLPIEPHFNKDIYTEPIGDREFYVLEVETDVGIMSVSQKYYIKIIDNYVLTFITTFIDDESGEVIEEILKNVEFE